MVMIFMSITICAQKDISQKNIMPQGQVIGKWWMKAEGTLTCPCVPD